MWKLFSKPRSSPVAGDSWLRPHEKPFTAFGQWGEGILDIRVFEQNMWWVDHSGKPHLLAEMNQRYLGNVLAFLFASAENYHAAVKAKRALEFVDALFLRSGPSFHLFLLSEPAISDDPFVWLKKTPLAMRLEELLDR